MDDKKCNFNSVKRLYHYTSMESAFKILESMTLRFGELNRMNDIYESCKSIFSEPFSDNETIKWDFTNDDLESEIGKYKQISLTMDRDKKKGFHIPAMWAHYAEKGEGVCIVFDRDKLLDRLPAIVEHHEVSYSDDFDPSILIKEQNASMYLRKNAKQFFFTKTMDWSYEQEYRLFSFDNSIQDISIEGCVNAVIMLYAKGVTRGESVFGAIDYRILQKIIPNIPILHISQFWGDVSVVDKNSVPVWASNPLSGVKLDL